MHRSAWVRRKTSSTQRRANAKPSGSKGTQNFFQLRGGVLGHEEWFAVHDAIMP